MMIERSISARDLCNGEILGPMLALMMEMMSGVIEMESVSERRRNFEFLLRSLVGAISKEISSWVRILPIVHRNRPKMSRLDPVLVR